MAREVKQNVISRTCCLANGHQSGHDIRECRFILAYSLIVEEISKLWWKSPFRLSISQSRLKALRVLLRKVERSEPLTVHVIVYANNYCVVRHSGSIPSSGDTGDL